MTARNAGSETSGDIPPSLSRSHRPRDKAAPGFNAARTLFRIYFFNCATRTGDVHIVSPVRKPVFRLPDRRRAESVRLDDIRAGFEVRIMDGLNLSGEVSGRRRYRP